MGKKLELLKTEREQRVKVVADAYNSGQALLSIAREFNLSLTVVKNRIKRARELGYIVDDDNFKKEEIIKYYIDNNVTLEDISKKFDVDIKIVKRFINNDRSYPINLRNIRIKKALDMYQDGKSINDIAKALCITNNTVRTWLKENKPIAK